MKRAYRVGGNYYASGGYSIEPVQDEHVELIRLWRNAQMDILRQRYPISKEVQGRYFEERIWPEMEKAEPDTMLFAYFRREEVIGYGGLVHLAWPHRRGEVSFLLAPHRVTDIESYCAEFAIFLDLIKQLAFDGLALRRIFTETYAMRTRHIATLEGSGFQLEGVLRWHVSVAGTPMDSLIHGCLRSDVDEG